MTDNSNSPDTEQLGKLRLVYISVYSRGYWISYTCPYIYCVKCSLMIIDVMFLRQLRVEMEKLHEKGELGKYTIFMN